MLTHIQDQLIRTSNHCPLFISKRSTIWNGFKSKSVLWNRWFGWCRNIYVYYVGRKILYQYSPTRHLSRSQTIIHFITCNSATIPSHIQKMTHLIIRCISSIYLEYLHRLNPPFRLTYFVNCSRLCFSGKSPKIRSWTPIQVLSRPIAH